MKNLRRDVQLTEGEEDTYNRLPPAVRQNGGAVGGYDGGLCIRAAENLG